jgi:hypothetical protein
LELLITNTQTEFGWQSGAVAQHKFRPRAGNVLDQAVQAKSAPVKADLCIEKNWKAPFLTPLNHRGLGHVFYVLARLVAKLSLFSMVNPTAAIRTRKRAQPTDADRAPERPPYQRRTAVAPGNSAPLSQTES